MAIIDDKQHVARYCSGRGIAPDGRITGTAFTVRRCDKGGLSVNWEEFLKLATREEVVKILSKQYESVMKKSFSADSKVAFLNVGNTKNHVFQSSDGKKVLDVIHDEENTHNPSHSRIQPLELDEFDIFNYIAETVIDTRAVTISAATDEEE